MIVTVGGKRWKFERKFLRGDADGLCDPPTKANKKITVHSTLRGKNELEIIIHELIHASAWKVLAEEYVAETAEDLARALYKIGYRKTE